MDHRCWLREGRLCFNEVLGLGSLYFLPKTQDLSPKTKCLISSLLAPVRPVSLLLRRQRVKVSTISSSRKERSPTQFDSIRSVAQCFPRPMKWRCIRGTLKPVREKPTREEMLSHYIHFVLDLDLRINTGERVVDVNGNVTEGFVVKTDRAEYQAARLLFAIGAMEKPRRLNVPGEELPKVHHLFVEPYPYVRKDALVVGGGNSAAEAALFLSEEGARTTMAIWREDWENRDPKAGAMKHWVRTPLEAEIEAGRLTVVLYKQVDEITETEVRLTTETVNR